MGDHFRATSTLMLDFGLRYERIGQFGDALGRTSSFDINHADPNPPSAGVMWPTACAANCSAWIRRVYRTLTCGKISRREWLAPRIGLPQRPLGAASRFVVRSGYGIYFSQPTGQAFFQSVFGAPFSFGYENIGGANAAATFNSPFPQPFPTPSFFPYFPPYSPTSDVAISIVSPDFRPAMIQEYGLNFQVALAKDWMLEVGYVGTRGTHLLRSRSLNQALPATTANSIRGVTSNTVANIGLRVPVQGVPPDALDMVESAGVSSYNGLEVSLSKRLSKGLQLLGFYTFSKTFDSDPGNVNGSSAGNTLTLGDQNSASERWGRASFDRTHRLIVSGTYAFPSPSDRFAGALFGFGWSTSGVLTLQSGVALTVAYNNLTNVFGISEDRAQVANRLQQLKSGLILAKRR